ncbi:hypothetical protein WA577_004648, partial [Blastocystis sp. JDR]
MVADYAVLCTLWNWILFVIDNKRVDLIWRVPDSRADIVKDYCAYQAMHSLITMGVVGFYFNSIAYRKSVSILSFLALDVGLALCLLFSFQHHQIVISVMTAAFLVVSIVMQSISSKSLRLYLCFILLLSLSVLLLIHSCIRLVLLLIPIRWSFSLTFINTAKKVIMEVQSVAILFCFASQLLIITLIRCCGLSLPHWLCVAPSCCLLCMFLLVHYFIQVVFLLHRRGFCSYLHPVPTATLPSTSSIPYFIVFASKLCLCVCFIVLVFYATQEPSQLVVGRIWQWCSITLLLFGISSTAMLITAWDAVGKENQLLLTESVV